MAGDATLNVKLVPEIDEEALREQARKILLGEAALIVKPGETLVIRTTGLTPQQIKLYQEYADLYTAGLDAPFRVLIVHGDELAIASAADDIAAFMKDVRVEQSHAAMGGTLLKTDLTHVPTGIEASARTLDEAVALLAGKIHRAHVAISGSQRHQVP